MPDNAPQYEFALLDKKLHDRAAFSCGEPELDEYLKRRAGQDMRESVTMAVTHVMTAVGRPREIVGYYTLSSFSVLLESLPEDVQMRLPKYDQVGTYMLGRLAVDQRFKGQRLGELLLLSALERSVKLSTTEAGAHAVVVDALHEKAKGFYLRYGFIPFSDEALRLYLPMKSARKLLE